MPSASKNKGSGFEREFAKFLTGVFGLPFMRASGSGAYIGRKNAFRKQHMSENQIRAAKSDIISPDELPLLVLETKFYKDFRFHQLFNNEECPQLNEWIDQVEATIDTGDVWFVVFKINLRGIYVAVSSQFSESMIFKNHCQYQYKKQVFKITEAKSFFETNKDEIARLSKK